MKRFLIFLALLGVMAVTLAPGCTTPDTGGGADKGPITVGSKLDTEASLLSQIIILMLEDNGFQVIDKSQFGTTDIVRSAIMSGELDIYPEYTGNGAYFFDETESDVWNDAQQGYQRVKQLDMEQNNIVWLKPAPANNTWAIAIPSDLAEQENIESLDDFAAYINGGGYVKLAGSEEFVLRPDALPAFQSAYGFSLTEDQLLTFAGGNTALTEKAAAEGTDGVNAAMAYGTDGSLSALGLVVLSDPRGVQPVYEPTPIVRDEVFQQYPEIADILDPVFVTLNLETLQTLNASIAVAGEDPTEVARNYLVSQGFLQ